MNLEDVDHQRPHSVYDNEHKDNVFTTDENLVGSEFGGKVLLDAYKDIPDYPYGDPPPFGCRHVWVGIADGLTVNPAPNEPVEHDIKENKTDRDDESYKKEVENAEVFLYKNNKLLRKLESKYIIDIKSRNNNLTNLLTDKQGTAIYNYTLPHGVIPYKTLNYNISRNIGTDIEKQYEIYLNDCLAKCPSFKGTTYRGQKSVTGLIKLEKGDIYEPKKFLSSSIKKGTADNFRGDGITTHSVSIIINSKTGRRIEEVSEFGDIETEILFNSKTKYEVNEISKEKNDKEIWTIMMIITEL